MKRTTIQTVVVVLLCVGIAAVWLLRPVIESGARNVLPLQVEAGCESAKRSCRLLGEGVEFELSLGPLLRTMETFSITVRHVRGDVASNAQVDVQFQMRDMDMGLNHYRLIADVDEVWRGQAMLPVCSSGRSDWLAQVTITTDGETWQAVVPFVVGG